MKYVWESLSLDSHFLKEGYHNNAREDILSILTRTPQRVLELGCGAGATGGVLKERYKAAWVIGIEPNAPAAALAKTKMDQVIVGKFEEVDMQKNGISPQSIDTIILADVLEHIYDPWATLLKLKPLLASGGEIFASIPNARNLVLMQALAHGFWSYQEQGLLDITHIRFFTRYEIIKMFQETGYRITRMESLPDARLSANPPPEKMPIDVNTDKLTIKNVGEEELLELRTLQFLVVATPV